MTEATTTVTTVATPAGVSIASIDDVFTFAHQLFDQYRTTIFVLTGTLMAACLYNKLWINRKFHPSSQTMQGKTVLITGGNAGIGYETAKDLLRRGARVVLLCRNMDKGREAIRKLRSQTECDKNNLRLIECDLCSFDSIRNAAKQYNDEEDRLDVLICNAGLAWAPNIVTKDGYNSVVQANYLGHFLLTNLLLDKLKQCRPSRILNVSSDAHRKFPSIDWDDIFTLFKSSRLFGYYPASKAYQILSSYKLKQDLLPEGINTFAISPGWVWTSLQAPMREAIGFYGFLVFYPLLYLLKIAFAKTPKTGARTTIYCAVEPTLQNSTDLYFKSCAPKQPIALTIDETNANRLWKLSEEAVGLQ